VLSGIGGSTIAEAQERLSYREFTSWKKYRNKRGSLNIGMRVERGAALLATLFANSKRTSNFLKLYDFMQHEDEPAIDLEKAIEEWR